MRPCNRLKEDICIEREKVSEFIQEQLDKKYIRPSKLSPVLCYDSKLKGLSVKLTLVLSDTRELDRVPNTK